MTIFTNLRRKRAIRQYVRKLPRQLYDDYGASTFFTPGQIVAAAQKLRLETKFLIYGYAMFLPENAFASLQPIAPGSPTYEDARTELAQYAPQKASGPGSFYESGLAFNAAGNSNNGPCGFVS